MSRIYAVTFNGTVTNAGGDTDLISIQPADDKPCRIRGFIISQTSEVGDTAEEGLRVTIKRLTATVTVVSPDANVTAAAPIDDSGGTTWGFTARTNDTTVMTSSGTTQVLLDMYWNERNSPYDFWFPDIDFCPKGKQTEALTLRIETTAADDLTVSGTMYVEEI